MVGHLRARIVLVVAMLAELVPFIANELIWTRADLAQHLEAIDKSMASSLARTLTAFADARDEVERLSETIALSHELRSLPPNNCNESLARILRIQRKVERISLIGPHGVIECSSDKSAVGVYVGDREYFKQALATDRVVWSDFIPSRIVNKVITQSARAVRSGNITIFVLAIALNTDYLRQVTLQQFELPLTHAMLLDANGNRLDSGTIFGTGSAISPETISRAIQIGDGLIQPGTYGAGDDVIGVARLPGTANRVAFGISTKAVHDAAVTNMLRRLAVMGLVILCVASLTYAALEWSILRWLRQATDVAGRISAGDWSRRVNVLSPLPDLSLLGRAINIMLDSLEMSVHSDGLTGLANRRALDRALQTSLQQLETKGLGFSLVMIDIDAFKAFNDHYGHASGDDVLRVLGTVIGKFASKPDEMAARYGGEEFTLVLWETDGQPLSSLVEQLRRDIEAMGIPHDFSPHGTVTVSIGYTVAVQGDSAISLISRADGWLYLAKANGRNRAEGGRGGATVATLPSPSGTGLIRKHNNALHKPGDP